MYDPKLLALQIYRYLKRYCYRTGKLILEARGIASLKKSIKDYNLRRLMKVE